MMSDAFSTPGAAEAFKYVADFSKEKEYPAFNVRRGQSAGKKIAIPNRTKESFDLELITEQPQFVELNADRITVKPDYYGFVRIKFSVPPDYTDQQLKVSVTARHPDSKDVHTVFNFTINVY